MSVLSKFKESDDLPEGRARHAALSRAAEARAGEIPRAGPSSTRPSASAARAAPTTARRGKFSCLDVCQEIRILQYLGRRCTYCGRCADVCPEKAITMSQEFETATNKIGDSGAAAGTVHEHLPALRTLLQGTVAAGAIEAQGLPLRRPGQNERWIFRSQRLPGKRAGGGRHPDRTGLMTAMLKNLCQKMFGRSLWVYHANSGGCNGCDIEVLNVLTPYYDVERFGIKLVGSPRHADVMLCQGPAMRATARALGAPTRPCPRPSSSSPSAPAPAAAASGLTPIPSSARWRKSSRSTSTFPAVRRGPEAIIYGVAVAVGLVDKKAAPGQVQATGNAHPALSPRRSPAAGRNGGLREGGQDLGSSA